MTGEDLYGQQIPDGVRSRIAECQGIVGFRTRRDLLASGKYTSHRWVSDEIAMAAVRSGMRILEVRETDVEEQGGVAGQYQWMKYDSEKRDEFLVQFVKTMAEWHREVAVQSLLMPLDAAKMIRRYRSSPSFKCDYVVSREEWQSPPQTGDVRVMNEGTVYIRMRNLRRGDIVQVTISAVTEGGRMEVWQSDWTNIDAIRINLEKTG